MRALNLIYNKGRESYAKYKPLLGLFAVIFISLVLFCFGIMAFYINDGRDAFFYTYLMVGFGFIAILAMLYLMIFKFKLALWKLYIPIGIFLGMVYLLIIPVYAVPDEAAHLCTAYHVSNMILNIKEPEDGTIVMMRQTDAESGFSPTDIDREYYNTYYKNLKKLFADDETLIETPNCMAQAPIYLYFFSSLGLTLGRLLHLNTIYVFLLGRVFNMMVFVISVVFSIKKIPFGKAVVFVWACLPMTLQEISSYSYDSPIFALCIIIISLSFCLAYEKIEFIKRREGVILLLCLMLLAPTKGYALIPICLLPMIIYAKKVGERRKIARYLACMCLAMIFAIIVMKAFPTLTFAEYQSTIASNGNVNGIIGWADEPGYSVQYMISHWKKTLYVCCNTIYENGDYYLGTFLGYRLGYLEMQVPLIALLPYLFFMILAGMKKIDDGIYMNVGMKLYICLLVLLGMGFAFGGLLLGWTPRSSDSILGIQGRYFLPFAPLLFLSIRSKNILVNDKVENKVVFSAVWLELLVFVLLYYRA